MPFLSGVKVVRSRTAVLNALLTGLLYLLKGPLDYLYTA